MVDIRTVRSKQRIRSALIALLETRALEDIAVRDVTAASGVGYTTFYRHYPTRRDLLAEVIDEELTALSGTAFPELLKGTTLRASQHSALHILKRRSLWLAMTSDTALPVLRVRLLPHMLELSHGIEMGSGFLPREVTASLAATLLIELLTWWLREDAGGSPEMLAEAIERIVVKPALLCW